MVNKTNGHVGDSAEKLANDASKAAAELGREMHHHTEHAKSDMVKMLYDAAKMLRGQARDTGANHEILGRVDDVATGFERAAGYLKHNSYGEISEDAVHTARRFPVRTMAIILVIGVIIGMLLRQNPSREDY